MTLSLIVAASENGVIGKDNDLPWHLPADLKHFKKITSGHCIIMGRNTYESIGRPLPKRTNIVISSNRSLEIEGCYVVHDVNEAIELTEQHETEEAFIIGGATLYKSCLDQAEKIYLTRVHTEIQGDTYFPEIDMDNWKVISEEYHEKDEKHLYSFSFITLIRKKLS